MDGLNSTGLGYSMGADSAQRVSPVPTSFSLAAATISPTPAAATSSCLAPSGLNRWVILSLASLPGLYTVLSAWTVPDSTLIMDSRPANGSTMVLNTNAESGPSAALTRDSASPDTGFFPSAAGSSSGEGSHSTTASSNDATPIPRTADP